VAKTTKNIARLTNVSQNQKSKFWEVKKYRRAYGNLRSNSRTLGEINPLGLTKLGSVFGSFERIFGLSIAARIASFKVCR
jgi:DNA polymerase/3'-5' exonuclease PolX